MLLQSVKAEVVENAVHNMYLQISNFFIITTSLTADYYSLVRFISTFYESRTYIIDYKFSAGQR